VVDVCLRGREVKERRDEMRDEAKRERRGGK